MFGKIFKASLPRVAPRVFKAKPGRPFGTKMSQKQLRALRDHGVPENAALNPHGRYGNSYRSRYRASYFKLTLKPAFREAAMKRTRLRLKAKKALALEAHELQQMAREAASLAMNTLIEISGNSRAPEANRIAASAVILDRAYGKASQTNFRVDATSNGKTSDIDGTDLDARINRAVKRVEELTARKTKTGAGKAGPADLRKYN